jgi:anti-sigma B factor antagonist
VVFQRDLRDQGGMTDDPSSLSVTVVRGPAAITRVLAAGEIDRASVGRLERAVEHEPASGTSALLVDFSRVSFCSSCGLHLLVSLQRRGDVAGVPLELVVSAPVLRVMQAAGLCPVFSTHENQQSALARLGVDRE